MWPEAYVRAASLMKYNFKCEVDFVVDVNKSQEKKTQKRTHILNYDCEKVFFAIIQLFASKYIPRIRIIQV